MKSLKSERWRRHPAKISSFGVTIERFPNGVARGRPGSRSGGYLPAVDAIYPIEDRREYGLLIASPRRQDGLEQQTVRPDLSDTSTLLTRAQTPALAPPARLIMFDTR